MMMGENVFVDEVRSRNERGEKKKIEGETKNRGMKARDEYGASKKRGGKKTRKKEGGLLVGCKYLYIY